MQKAPPRYMKAEPEVVEPEPKRKKPVRRKRRRPVPTEPTFDVTRWRLPAKWRNDRRVGDVAMAKMTKGCEMPGRWDL